MPTTIGNIWAQATWSVAMEVSVTHEIEIVFSQPRKLHAQANLSHYRVSRSSHGHALGATNPHWWAQATANIVRHSQSDQVGQINHNGTSVLAVENATTLTFGMIRLFNNCAGTMHANFTIYYF